MVKTASTMLPLGTRAPSFSLPNVDGTTVSLADFSSSKALVVIFMCNHCPYVKAKVDAINELQNRFKGKLAVIGINSNDAVAYPDDSFDSMKEFAKQRKDR